ncbi:MAG: hypothetical protein P1V36_05080 [Planctomycetota bacterium]|nr:hypothetical protein [Planctomycetota bacterium]
MSHEPVKVEIFDLGLLIRRKSEGGQLPDAYHARAVFRTRGLTASLTTLVDLTPAEIEDLLQQIETQYGDFRQAVAWRSADGLLDLGWQLDELGHAAGRIRLEDPMGEWRLDAPLVGDQSYLPQMALGLRLLLRPEDWHPPAAD